MNTKKGIINAERNMYIIIIFPLLSTEQATFFLYGLVELQEILHYETKSKVSKLV